MHSWLTGWKHCFQNKRESVGYSSGVAGKGPSWERWHIPEVKTITAFGMREVGVPIQGPWSFLAPSELIFLICKTRKTPSLQGTRTQYGSLTNGSCYPDIMLTQVYPIFKALFVLLQVTSFVCGLLGQYSISQFLYFKILYKKWLGGIISLSIDKLEGRHMINIKACFL